MSGGNTAVAAAPPDCPPPPPSNAPVQVARVAEEPQAATSGGALDTLCLLSYDEDA